LSGTSSGSTTLPQITGNPTDTVILSNTITLLEQYKTASDIARDAPERFFDQIVAKVLFPALTAVIGYIFGSRSSGNNSEG